MRAKSDSSGDFRHYILKSADLQVSQLKSRTLRVLHAPGASGTVANLSSVVRVAVDIAAIAPNEYGLCKR